MPEAKNAINTEEKVKKTVKKETKVKEQNVESTERYKQARLLTEEEKQNLDQVYVKLEKGKYTNGNPYIKCKVRLHEECVVEIEPKEFKAAKYHLAKFENKKDKDEFYVERPMRIFTGKGPYGSYARIEVFVSKSVVVRQLLGFEEYQLLQALDVEFNYIEDQHKDIEIGIDF